MSEELWVKQVKGRPDNDCPTYNNKRQGHWVSMQGTPANDCPFITQVILTMKKKRSKGSRVKPAQGTLGNDFPTTINNI